MRVWLSSRSRTNQQHFDRQFPQLKPNCRTPRGDPLQKLAEANVLLWQRHTKKKQALAKAIAEMQLSIETLLESENTMYFDISD